MPKVVYAGAFRFPDGDAAAARVLGIGKALRDAGYDVEYAGWEERGRDQDRCADGKFRFEGFAYFSQSEFRTKRLNPLSRLVRYLTAGKKTLEWIRKNHNDDIAGVIAYNSTTYFLWRLRVHCHKRNIPLIVDCTEWYDSRSLVGGRFGLVAFDNWLRMRVINRLIGRIIAISGYLARFYALQGCSVAKIPPLVDLKEAKWPNVTRTLNNSRLRLVYAGSPAKKDLLGLVLRGLVIAKRTVPDISIDIFGPGSDDVVRCLDGDTNVLKLLGDSVQVHGRVAQERIPGLLSLADFSILVRPDERYARAGFSTKLVESLSAGVPVIANLTGDIGECVRDGQEGIIISDCSEDAVASGILRAAHSTPESRAEMRRLAKLAAQRLFDYRNYVEDVVDILHGIKSDSNIGGC